MLFNGSIVRNTNKSIINYQLLNININMKNTGDTVTVDRKMLINELIGYEEHQAELNGERPRLGAMAFCEVNEGSLNDKIMVTMKEDENFLMRQQEGTYKNIIAVFYDITYIIEVLNIMQCDCVTIGSGDDFVFYIQYKNQQGNVTDIYPLGKNTKKDETFLKKLLTS